MHSIENSCKSLPTKMRVYSDSAEKKSLVNKHSNQLKVRKRKTMIQLLKSSLFLLLTLSLNQAFGQVLLPLKAAELACHRIDRLVVQNKIDKNFLNKFEKMDFIKLAANDPSGARYLVVASQTLPQEGTPLSVSIYLDVSGKVLNYNVNSGGVAGPDVQWTGKDPITLTEVSLHHLLDEYESNSALRPFAENFQTLTIAQKEINGKIVAVVTLTSITTTNKLNILLDLNGAYLSEEVVP